MRLGQLARKLALRPGEIVDFLAAQNIPVNESSNTRLDDGHVALVIQEFAPGMQDILNEPDAPEETVNVNTGPPAGEVPAPVADETGGDAEITGVDIPAGAYSTEEEPAANEPAGPEEEKTEVIKAAKVELPGLKVVGKIDLQEPKRKEPEAEGEPAGEEMAAAAGQPEERRDRGKRNRTKRKPGRSEKNPVALRREREAREVDKKKRIEVKREKERRTEHYLKKVKPAVPTKRARLFDEPVEEMSEAFKETPRRSIWGKFVKWLRRE